MTAQKKGLERIQAGALPAPLPAPPRPLPEPAPTPPAPAPAVLPVPVPVPAVPPPEASVPVPFPPPSAELCPKPVPALGAMSLAAFGAFEFSCPVAGEVEGVPFVLPGFSEFGFSVPLGATAKRPRASPAGMLAPGVGCTALRDRSGSSALPCISSRAT
jgi:hypothetical protein